MPELAVRALLQNMLNGSVSMEDSALIDAVCRRLITSGLRVASNGAIGASTGLGYINVKDPAYGAAGDGLTDDTAAIQAAFNAVSTAGSVFLPQGTYKCTSAFTSVGKSINLVGAGRDVSILSFGSTGVDGWGISSGSRIAHVTLRGPNASSSGNAGLDSGNATDVTVEDCIIEQWGDAGINTGGTSAIGW